MDFHFIEFIVVPIENFLEFIVLLGFLKFHLKLKIVFHFYYLYHPQYANFILIEMYFSLLSLLIILLIDHFMLMEFLFSIDL